MIAMKKVILKLGSGNLRQGCHPVLVELWDMGKSAPMQFTASLPPAPRLATLHEQWRMLYRVRNQNQALRISILNPSGLQYSETEFSLLCEQLPVEFNAWLSSPSFLSVEQKLRTELSRTDAIQIIIETNDVQLQTLPWHLWQLLDDYARAEVALSALTWKESPRPQRMSDRIRILTILGDSTGIDVQTDYQTLRALPNTELVLLDQPRRQQVNDQLWEPQGWDILFFAGHSQTENNTGQIYPNPSESLTIAQLKHSLTRAIENGLKIAIFNSCDGLGLAQQFADLDIPYIIVMREPVPDQVAQAFLRYFLQAFSRGCLLHQAVREARQRLSGLEGDSPCASWLPVIWQNPTAMPLCWADLSTAIEPSAPAISAPRPKTRWRLAALVSLLVTSVVLGSRSLGSLEALELTSYDYLMRQRPTEPIDPRILVVEITQEDTNRYGYPLPDDVLSQTIDTLQQAQPRAIGLDLHRPQSQGQTHPLLMQRFANTSNLFLVCAYSSTDVNHAPPMVSPEKIRNQVGFSDLLVDGESTSPIGDRNDLAVGAQLVTENTMVRRQLLSYNPNFAPSPSACSTPYSFSFQLVFQFLHEAGVQPLEVNAEQIWQFGNTSFPELKSRTGGYQSLDGQSSQILINYRSNQPGRQVTLQQILTNQIEPDLIRNQIILVGYTSPIARDYFNTPYGTMAGIWIHAHMTSQMISAVIDNRPLVWTLPQWRGIQWGDGIWILSWAAVGGVIGCSFGSKLRYFGLAISGSTVILYQGCLWIFIQAGWMPLVPSLLALWGTASLVVGVQLLAPSALKHQDRGL